MVEMNAIYIHGLGSGAATSAVKTISKILPQYKWHPLEMLDEDVCREFERDSRLDLMTPGDVSLNLAVFSIHDELIGPVGILENMAVCQRLDYTILIDDKGGHRLDKSSLRKIRDEIFKTDFGVLKYFWFYAKIPVTN